MNKKSKKEEPGTKKNICMESAELRMQILAKWKKACMMFKLGVAS